jgi:hypothetical protein
MDRDLLGAVMGCRGRLMAVIDERLPDDATAPGHATGISSCGHRRGQASIAGKRRDDLPSWALSPLAVERIRLVMLERLEQRSSLLALRDALAVSIQYGLAMRNQEIWPYLR